jgi:hypothetical protein
MLQHEALLHDAASLLIDRSRTVRSGFGCCAGTSLAELAAMTIRLIIAAGTIGVLLSATAARPATAEGGSVAETCPAYRTHLRNARVCLTRGDRSATLMELKRAQDALESCLRDEGGEVALASCRLWTPIG